MISKTDSAIRLHRCQMILRFHGAAVPATAAARAAAAAGAAAAASPAAAPLTVAAPVPERSRFRFR